MRVKTSSNKKKVFIAHHTIRIIESMDERTNSLNVLTVYNAIQMIFIVREK